MKQLPALNAQRFFCHTCGIGEEGNCQGFHVEQLSQPGSRARHYALISMIGIIAVIVFIVGLVSAARI